MTGKRVFNIIGKCIYGLIKSVKRSIKKINDFSTKYGECDEITVTDNSTVLKVKIKKSFVVNKSKHNVSLNVFNLVKSVHEQEGTLYKIHDQYYLYKFEIDQVIFDTIKNNENTIFRIQVGQRQFKVRSKRK